MTAIDRTFVQPTTSIDPDRTLGDLVAERPSRARVFEAAGIDYCCHGRRSLTEAAASAGIAVDAVITQLEAVVDVGGHTADDLAPAELAAHIEGTHHAYLHQELPALEALAAKVASVHGSNHPELAEVARLTAALRADLEPHLAKEERVLFPAIASLSAGPTDVPFGSMSNPIGVLRAEHEQTGELLAALRVAARDYQLPADACTSYRSLYERLPLLEADTFRHIHLENNVLFPAVEAL